MQKNKCDAIILAAGLSKRFKGKTKKQFIKFNNKNLIDLTINKFQRINNIETIHLVLPNEHITSITSKFKNVSCIEGGSSRIKSVFNALSHLHSTDYPYRNILIHDIVRPCVDESDIIKLINLGNKNKTGICLGYPITNALKLVNMNIIKSNINREKLWSTFTPQIFNFLKLFDSYKYIIKNKITIDDEAEAMTIQSHKIKILLSSPGNIKLTYKEDLSSIKKLLK
ncbi:MAG: hypothetical protein CMD88_02600 [Gammaproteobacteria bacterium]|nr:hypothetical protein [Gammaproteobacteria bacterium]|tara:strand:- start:26909 stop:27586 length:678 start_codon:yes stop_codon:yes gene_type:complete